ncbi:archaeal proteasome endopeptidase complex subunit alpha [Aeropyrum camini]|uniref:Proteasome subunit alpha n=1 Tax=Aeropyrum camini SY1 = JCM 12091 TaxID=1198449 RepID=U3TD76_9CREN|nr:archaeal proteasome endopeptidase complex subunit alpha [Aeropyrum camini]BAN90381.1 proteasome subunit alpha [Aeropyrum camini SY1 = JCM 12091]
MAFPMPPHQTAYDRAATIFSPEGDLYQVRYAFEAVKKGWTSLGIKTKDGVVIAAEKRFIGPLVDIDDIDKIYKIDDHIGVAFAGMGGDGRILIDYARMFTVRHRLLYGEPPPVELVAKVVADVKQAYTQHGGVRPFGVALIFAGVNPDGTTKVYRTDPGGQYFSFKAIAIGSGEQVANEMFEKHYRSDMSLEEAIKLTLKILYAIIRKTVEDTEKAIASLPEQVELAYITVKDRMFIKMTKEQVKEVVDSIRDELMQL